MQIISNGANSPVSDQGPYRQGAKEAKTVSSAIRDGTGGTDAHRGRRGVGDRTIQNISACSLTFDDYETLRRMVDRKIIQAIPISDDRTFTVTAPIYFPDLFHYKRKSRNKARPWHSVSMQQELGGLKSLRSRTRATLGIDGIMVIRVIRDSFLNVAFCICLWFYLLKLMHCI
ncbi:MAG: hypothetical protein SFV17_03185 [Candidatus Obscuribacter sp.]|nr:hypothetical protein [Candidatus Obscuribacter sp.]